MGKKDIISTLIGFQSMLALMTNEFCKFRIQIEGNDNNNLHEENKKGKALSIDAKARLRNKTRKIK